MGGLYAWISEGKDMDGKLKKKKNTAFVNERKMGKNFSKLALFSYAYLYENKSHHDFGAGIPWQIPRQDRAQ